MKEGGIRSVISRASDSKGGVLVEPGGPHGSLVALERTYPIPRLPIAQHRLSICGRGVEKGEERAKGWEINDEKGEGNYIVK